MKNELQNLAREWFRDGYTPNAGKIYARNVESSPAITAFMVYLQRRGADVVRWSEAEWRKTLAEEFAVDEDYMADQLEDIASWGAVDDAYWGE